MLTVLLAVQDDLLQDVVKVMLELAPARVVSVSERKAATGALTCVIFDAVIFSKDENEFPEDFGLTAKQIQGAVSTVKLLGYGSSSTTLGVDYFLRKPFAPEDLNALLSQIETARINAGIKTYCPTVRE